VARKQKKLPRFVRVENDRWFVVRSFPSREKYANGRKRYIQIKRRCTPETAERAAAIAAEIEAAFFVEISRAAQPMTIAMLAERFLASKRDSIARRTLEIYEEMFRRFVNGHPFGEELVVDADPLMLQDTFDYYKSTGVPAVTLGRLKATLSAMFNQAVAWRQVDENPVRRVLVPKHNKKKAVVMGEKEAKTFLAACREGLAYFVFEFALETFMRPGEYLALRWSDIDLEERLVSVNRAIAVNYRGGGYEFKEPKTRGSKRVIAISEQLAERLLEHKGRQKEWIAEKAAIASGEALLAHMQKRGKNFRKRSRAKKVAREIARRAVELDLVFPASNGGPISRMNLRAREFQAVLDKAGLLGRGLTLYSLRHTGITLSLLAGVNIKAVSEKAGHASIGITLDTYSHVIPAMRQEATDRLAALLY